LYRLRDVRVSGRLTVTGYKYNVKTGEKTDLPDGCYIDFQNVQNVA